MADQKISALTELAAADVAYDTDFLAIVDTTAAATKKVTPRSIGIPAGVMFDFAGAGSVPAGYLLCDGSAVSRTTYSVLFTAIGTTWGVGDGSTTFNLPSMARRVSMGSGGSGTATIDDLVGSTGGSETHTLGATEIPATFNLNVNGGSQYTVPTATSAVAHNIVQPAAIFQKIIKF